MKFLGSGSELGSSYSPDPAFPHLSHPAHRGRVWEPNYQRGTTESCFWTFSIIQYVKLEGKMMSIERFHVMSSPLRK